MKGNGFVFKEAELFFLVTIFLVAGMMLPKSFWAHARRKFMDALDEDRAKATEAVWGKPSPTHTLFCGNDASAYRAASFILSLPAARPWK